MSSDAEDYDGDTNWEELAAIRDTLSPRRPRVQPSAPSGASSTRGSLSRPVENSNIAAVQGQAQPSESGVPSVRTNRAITTAATTPAVAQGNGVDGRSGSISRSHGNSRVQAMLSALSSDTDEKSKKEGGSSATTLSKGKRKRSAEVLKVRKNKLPHVQDLSASVEVQKVLNGYGEELSCPICLDFFLAPQLLNPCGHTICEDCIDYWLSKSSDRQCPTCRASLSYPSPHLPNYAIGGAVDRYIELKRANNDAGWLEGGAKWKERQIRKRTYEVVKEMKNTQVRKARNWTDRPALPDSLAHWGVLFPSVFTDSRADTSLLPAGHGRTRVAPPINQEIIQIPSDNEGDEWSD